MKWWPFSKPEITKSADLELSTLDRLVNRKCSRDEFFLLYSRLLQERMPGCQIEFSGDATLRLVKPDNGQGTLFLENLWLKYCEVEDRMELIELYIRNAARLGTEAAGPDRNRVVPVIKDSRFVELTNLDAEIANRKADLLKEHLCGDLWVVYCEDQNERITTLKRNSITALGISENELRQLAVENLRTILPPAQCHGSGPWYLLTAGADYVASLLLFDRIWDQTAKMVDGDLVATVPTRDVLMFTGSNSIEGIAEIRKRSSEICNTGPHAISDTLIVRRNGTWSVFNAH